jgi:hypothetical protein
LRKTTVPSPPLLADTLSRYEAESATELWILGQDLLLAGGEGEGQGAGQLVKHHSWEAVRNSCWRGGVLRQHRFQADPLMDRMLYNQEVMSAKLFIGSKQKQAKYSTYHI